MIPVVLHSKFFCFLMFVCSCFTLQKKMNIIIIAQTCQLNSDVAGISVYSQ